MQNMKVRVLFKPKSQLKNKIRDTYIDLYRKFKRENPTYNTYTRNRLQQNIRNVLSVGRISIDDVLLRQSTYNPWQQNGWVEIPPYNHWYFAVLKKTDKKGRIFFEIQDCIYEAYHHNDTMQTQPYNESIRKINESQLRNIIKESIKRALNII